MNCRGCSLSQPNLFIVLFFEVTYILFWIHNSSVCYSSLHFQQNRIVSTLSLIDFQCLYTKFWSTRINSIVSIENGKKPPTSWTPILVLVEHWPLFARTIIIITTVATEAAARYSIWNINGSENNAMWCDVMWDVMCTHQANMVESSKIGSIQRDDGGIAIKIIAFAYFIWLHR